MNNPLRWLSRSTSAALPAEGKSMTFPSSGFGTPFVPYFSNRPVSGYELADPRSNSALMAVIGWIQRNFPEPRPQVMQPGPDGWVEVDDHPMTALLEFPNPVHSEVIHKMALVIDLLADGNAYEVKDRSESERPANLWYVPNWQIEPRWDTAAAGTNTLITHYDYFPGGVQPIHLPVEDVIHHRWGIDPKNVRKGLSPLKALVRELYTDEEGAAFTSALLKNFGIPGVVISPSPNSDYEPSDDDVQATKEYINSNFKGENRGQPLVFSGPVNAQQFGFSPEQLTLRDVRQIPEERISGVFGIGAIVAGLGAGLERSTFTNFKEAREAATEQNLVPLWRLFASTYRHQLLPEYTANPSNYRVQYDLTGVRVFQDDENAKAQRMTRLVDGSIMMRSEARARMGLEVRPEDKVFVVKPGSVMVTREGELVLSAAPNTQQGSPGGRSAPPPALPPSNSTPPAPVTSGNGVH